jgi:hypothetical protein
VRTFEQVLAIASIATGCVAYLIMRILSNRFDRRFGKLPK